jgi:hypothetical protein
MGVLQGLFEVGLDVLDVFDADGDPDQVRTHSGGRLLVGGQLLMRGRGRMDHESLGVAHVGQVAGQFNGVDELARSIESAGYSEAQDCPKPVPEVLSGSTVGRVGGQSWILHPRDSRVLLEPLGKSEGVVDMPLDP